MVMSVRSATIFLTVALAASFAACAGDDTPASPKETLYTYSKARKKKDLTTMKMLLSKETMKMHEQEAKAQGLTVDDIIERETLISETQNVIKVRNEKIDGDKATLEVENSFGSWETLPFVFEDGQWKIDKRGYADRLLQDIEMENQRLDQIIQGGGIPTSSPTPPQ